MLTRLLMGLLLGVLLGGCELGDELDEDLENPCQEKYDPAGLTGTEATCYTFGERMDCTLTTGHNQFGNCSALCVGEYFEIFSPDPLAANGQYTFDWNQGWSCVAKP